MKNLKLITFCLISFLIAFTACETTELDLRTDPNNATPAAADVQLLLNGAVNNFRLFNQSLTDFGMEVTRMKHGSGPVYDNAYVPQNFNTLWNRGYAGVIADTKSIIKNGKASSLYEHVAAAKILQSYTLTSLVDMFGDIPYSEAIQFTGNLNPKLDDDLDVYKNALALLDEAIADFSKESLKNLSTEDDIFFSGEKAKWVTLAKTLKLRIYNNVRLTTMFDKAAVDALIADNDLILAESNEFAVTYGTSQNDPDNRHFKFRNAYLGDGGEYMATYFMNTLYASKSNPDPRTNYYFYRQSLAYPDPSTSEGLFTMPCLGETKPIHYGFNDPFCNIGNGYWGRDHFDNAGGPPDGNKITVWGLYPAGGKYDNNEGTPVKDSDGAKGAGIMPIWLPSNTNFVLAELALKEGTSGSVLDYLEKGIRYSINKVLNFNTTAIPPTASTPSNADIDSYVTEVTTNYNNAASDQERLNIIITEAYISNWGNGIEVYNNYRRTSMPNNMQPTKSSNPGKFIRSFPYPADLVNLNSNVNAKSGNDVKVFWDLNPDNLN